MCKTNLVEKKKKHKIIHLKHLHISFKTCIVSWYDSHRGGGWRAL